MFRLSLSYVTCLARAGHPPTAQMAPQLGVSLGSPVLATWTPHGPAPVSLGMAAVCPRERSGGD